MSIHALVSQMFAHSGHTATKENIDTEDTGGEPSVPEGRELAEVIRVVDGDTIIINYNGKEETVRFLLVDTPEVVHPEMGEMPYGQEASDYVKEMLKSGQVQIEFEDDERDIYGRLLAYVYDEEGNSVQEGLLEKGFARVEDYFNPTAREVANYKAIQDTASTNQEGIWSVPDYVLSSGYFFEEHEPAGVAQRYTQNISSGDGNFTSTAKELGAKVQFRGSGYDRSTYTSFSGTDINIAVSFKGGKPVKIGEGQTLTYSIFRPMEPVYALGSAKPKGFVRGPRTIAGSIIFTVFDRHVMLDKFYKAFEGIDANCTDKEYLGDELPPFDIHAVFMNEYGMSAQLVIHGVHLTSEGQVMSIEDMLTENTMQYVASDITLMRPGVN